MFRQGNMAYCLLFAVVVATTSSVFAQKLLVDCDAIAVGKYRDCSIPEVGGQFQDTFHYYGVRPEMIRAYCGSRYPRRCKADLRWDDTNNHLKINIPDRCNGTYEIKSKFPGHTYLGGCGQNNFASNDLRPTNLEQAGQGQFPWMAIIYITGRSGSCKGTILSDRWILTSAHCIIEYNGNGQKPRLSDVEVRTGNPNNYDTVLTRSVKSLVVHPNYNFTSSDHRTYDIGLMELTKPIRWDGNHSPVCLNNVLNIRSASNLECIHTDWPSGGTYLRWAGETISSRKECEKVYSGYGSNSKLTFCANATYDTTLGYCFDDSYGGAGGPLVCKRNNRFFQYGLVTHYPLCGSHGLYTNVAKFSDWIKSYVPNVNPGISG